MDKYLPNLEIKFYFLFYGILLTAALYNIKQIDNSSLPDYEYMTDGWKFLNRKVDDYDLEWESWSSYLRNCWAIYLIHILFSEFSRIFKFKNPSLVFTLVTTIFIYYHYNYKFLVFLVLYNLTYFVAAKMYNKYCVWLLAFFWIFVINLIKQEANTELASIFFNINVTKINQLLIIMAWTLLRGLSFGLENIDYVNMNFRDSPRFSFICYLGYSFYFPTFLFGPNIIYSRYLNMLTANFDGDNYKESMQRFLKLFLNLIRYSFWILFTDFCLHFFYIHAIQYNSELIKSMNYLAFYGLGYLMGQFFHNKYTVFYGTGIAFGNFDRIEMPEKPKCICRIHIYIDMWKYFDRGLYEFLFKYIYSAMCKKTSSIKLKLIAGLATFIFIFAWHGVYDFIFIWSIMNCTCLVMEKLLYTFLESETYLKTVRRFLKSENMVLRLNAFLSSHILIPSIISNFYFFGGKEIGDEFIKRTYFSGFFVYLKLSLCLYFLYPTAEWIKRYSESRTKKNVN